jgi:hypothetical protein
VSAEKTAKSDDGLSQFERAQLALLERQVAATEANTAAIQKQFQREEDRTAKVAEKLRLEAEFTKSQYAERSDRRVRFTFKGSSPIGRHVVNGVAIVTKMGPKDVDKDGQSICGKHQVISLDGPSLDSTDFQTKWRAHLELQVASQLDELARNGDDEAIRKLRQMIESRDGFRNAGGELGVKGATWVHATQPAFRAIVGHFVEDIDGTEVTILEDAAQAAE